MLFCYINTVFFHSDIPQTKSGFWTPVDINNLTDTFWHPPLLMLNIPHDPNVCAWHTLSYRNFHSASLFSLSLFSYYSITRFSSLFHFQSSKLQGVISLCCINTSLLLVLLLMWSLISGCVTCMHDKEPLNMISNVLVMYALINNCNIWINIQLSTSIVQRHTLHCTSCDCILSSIKVINNSNI